MKSLGCIALLLLLGRPQPVSSQSGLQTCTGPVLRFPPPSRGRCIDSMQGQRGETKVYPQDFDEILNEVSIYRCPSRGKRVIVSNGIPNHEVTLQNRNAPCEFHWVVELPLQPKVASERTEVPIRGMIAMATNGVPAYGPQEADYLNAVEGTMGVPGARYWYGHAGPNSAWHVHNPKMGQETESREMLMGYALDGFAIYGHLEDDSVLDACNGLYGADGSYRYHVRTLEQVDDSQSYCNGNSPEVNWNYILGCYQGSVDETEIFDSTEYSLDNDCVIDDEPTDGADSEETTDTTPTNVAAQDPEPKDTSATAAPDTPTRPNIILMQPDDMMFYDEWSRPPNSPNFADETVPFPAAGLPNLERLRLNGLQMMQAYTASPMCGTSRFATITGRYPSRAVTNDGGDSPPDVVISKTKLEGDDCEKNNLAVQFRGAGYRTAMFGKWHLSYLDRDEYTYESAVDTVKGCGFETVSGLYMENLSRTAFNDGSFSHNMEWITSEALKIIEEDSEEPFFMYFNPTVPHSSNSIADALTDFSCRDTAAGTLDADPIIPGMTDNGCAEYRQTIFDRSLTEDDKDLGAIWLDDSVGALLRALESTGKLENSILLFQQDHGINPKGSLYEGGIRIPQFVHFPAGINAGTQLNAPVSVIDVGATLLDFAGITPSYEMDGLSWRTAIASDESSVNWDDRCLFFELEQDRAVRCGCYKYLSIFDEEESTTHVRGVRHGLANNEENLFDLCLGSDSYANEIQGGNAEAANVMSNNPSMASDLATLHSCHLDRIEAADFSQCQRSFSVQDVGVASAEASTSPTSNPSPDPTRAPSASSSVKSPTVSPNVVLSPGPSDISTSDSFEGPTTSPVDPTASPSGSSVPPVPTAPPTSPISSSAPTVDALSAGPTASPSVPLTTDEDPTAGTSNPTQDTLPTAAQPNSAQPSATPSKSPTQSPPPPNPPPVTTPGEAASPTIGEASGSAKTSLSSFYCIFAVATVFGLNAVTW